MRFQSGYDGFKKILRNEERRDEKYRKKHTRYFSRIIEICVNKPMDIIGRFPFIELCRNKENGLGGSLQYDV